MTAPVTRIHIVFKHEYQDAPDAKEIRARWAAECEAMKPRWKREAEACIEAHNLKIYGDKWPNEEA